MLRVIASIPPPVTGANKISEAILEVVPNTHLVELGGNVTIFKLMRNIVCLVVSRIFGHGANYAVITVKRKLFLKDLFILLVTRSNGFLHAHNICNYSMVQIAIFRRLIGNRTMIIVSEALIKEFSRLTTKITVVSNFSPDVVRGKRITDKWNNRLVCISNLIYDKGIERLFRISAENNVVIDLYGYPVEFSGDYLSEWSQKYPESRVRYFGPLDSTTKFKISLENYIFILASKSECLPLVLLEAASFSWPILSTDVGAVTDCLTDGFNGFLIDESDDLGERLQLIDKDYSYYSRNSRSLYEHKFTRSIFVKRLNEVLNV